MCPRPPSGVGASRLTPRGCSPSTPQGGSLCPAQVRHCYRLRPVAFLSSPRHSQRSCRAYGAGYQSHGLTPTPSLRRCCTTPVCQSRPSGFAVEKLRSVIGHRATCHAVFQALTASHARRALRSCSVGGTMLPTQPFFTNKGVFMRLDNPAFLSGLRTSGALLVGNSALVYAGVLGQPREPATTSVVIFLVGFVMLVITSLTKGK